MDNSNRYISIGGAAKLLGVSVETLRRWEAIGKLVPSRTLAGHRRYDTRLLGTTLQGRENDSRLTLAYARVSALNQGAELERQKSVLENFCTERGWNFELVAEVGSGMDGKREGLQRLLDDIISGQIERLVLTNRDSLFRFGAELVFAICEIKQVEVVILNQSQGGMDEAEIGIDVLEFINQYSVRFSESQNSRKQNPGNDLQRFVSDVRETDRL